jgi:prolipoprotein diacylglyceryl transferase
VTTTILASFPSPARGVWYLGPIPIRAYAIFILIGIIVALVIGDRRWAARGGERGVIYDIALWAVPFGLLGGRLYHVATDWRTYFGPDGAGPLAALQIWQGGLGIWGAVALGGVGAWIGCRLRGIPLPAFGDAIAPGIILAQAIGRVGNYFNQELYGRPTDLPWGMEIFLRREPSGIIDVHAVNGVSTGQVFATVHPTFLYELLWNVLVFVILILIDRRFTLGHGRLFASYVALYCVGRFGVELLRDDTATHIEGIRINSYTATLVFLGAIVYIILAPKGREDPETLRGKAVDADETAPELVRELVAVASGTGVVAAAAAAGREDTTSGTNGQYGGFPAEDEPEFFFEDPELLDGDAESAVEEEPGGAAEEFHVDPDISEGDSGPPATSGDADDVETDPEDESIVEAEAWSPDVEIETTAAGEEVLIDEDHDPVDEEDFEGVPTPDVTRGPISEQEESFDAPAGQAVSGEDAGAVGSVGSAGAVGAVGQPAAETQMVVRYASDALPEGILPPDGETAETGPPDEPGEPAGEGDAVVSNDADEVTPEQTSAETPEDVTGETPEDTPDEAATEAADGALEIALEDAPEDSPEETPDRRPKTSASNGPRQKAPTPVPGVAPVSGGSFAGAVEATPAPPQSGWYPERENR